MLNDSNTHEDRYNRFERRFILWFAAALVFVILAYCFAVTFLYVPTANRDIANYILGVLTGTGLTTIIAFFFGTSKSSKDKDEAIAKMANNQPPQLPTPLPVTIEEEQQPKNENQDADNR